MRPTTQAAEGLPRFKCLPRFKWTLAEFERLSEPGWRDGGDVHVVPDSVVSLSGSEPDVVPPREVRLMIEISESTTRYDLNTTASLYAAIGVREYWGAMP